MAEFFQAAFTAGELSPELLARSDTDKYQLGLARARNGLIDYRGGFVKRPGMEFIDHIEGADGENAVKTFAFKYSPDLRDSYFLIFGNLYLRFMQGGGYVLEQFFTITNISASLVVTTSAPHGYANGDWVYIKDADGMEQVNRRTYLIDSVTSTTFRLRTYDNLAVDTTYFTAYAGNGEVAKVYTVPTPYAQADLNTLSFSQWGNGVEITSNAYPDHRLTRLTSANWTLVQNVRQANLSSPGAATVTPSAAGTAGVGFEITAVDAAGAESLPSMRAQTELTVNYTLTAGSIEVSWPAVPEAVRYNIYRTLVLPVGSELTRADDVGYVGTAFGPRFVDNNITPDFTASPPVGFDPFSHKGITHIDVLTGGTGYAKSDTISITAASGSGFIGYPVIDATGAIIAVTVLNGGNDYTSPTVTVATSGGAGATFAITLAAESGNYPAVSAVFQQRRIYAGTFNQPLTVWGSQPGKFNNFNYSLRAVPDDAYTYIIDGEEASPIRHLMPVQVGLMVMSQSKISLITGDSSGAVSATTVQSSIGGFDGVGIVRPLQISQDIVHTGGLDNTVSTLRYVRDRGAYVPTDVSTYSDHFFEDDTIISWAWLPDRSNTVLACTKRGYLLTLTYRQQEQVYAWTRCETNGLYEEVQIVQEDGINRAYFVVRRKLNGIWRRHVERFALSQLDTVEDSFFVDAGLSRVLLTPNKRLEATAASGANVTFTAESAQFGPVNAGTTLFFHDAIVDITSYVSPTVLIGTYRRNCTNVFTDTGLPRPAYKGGWSYGKPVSEFFGMDHLEGETVTALVDGNVYKDLTVEHGRVTLPVAGVKIVCGYNYTSEMRTLPISTASDTLEGRQKVVISAYAYLRRSRGVEIGSDFAHLYPLRERTSEPFGLPAALRTAETYALIAGSWSGRGEMCFRQSQPLPMGILGVVLKVGLENA